MSLLPDDLDMVKRLIVKDWQIYQKQLAGYVVGLLVALSLIGLGKPWSFSTGALLMVVLLVVVGSYAINSSLLAERKEQTMPFIMSLPVTPTDYYWGKLLANLLIYLVPLGVAAGTTVLLIFTTPLPDGLLVYSLLVFAFMLTIFCVSLCVTIAVESEGWNVFTQLALMTLLGPFILVAGRLDGVGAHLNTDRIVWSPAALAVLAANALVVATAIGITTWCYGRKTSFL